jgi:hypothetical protein
MIQTELWLGGAARCARGRHYENERAPLLPDDHCNHVSHQSVANDGNNGNNGVYSRVDNTGNDSGNDSGSSGAT